MQKRVFAIGVASVALGAVGAALVLNEAGAASVTSSLVPITPCRLVDTRPAPDHVGERTGALGASETVTLQVIGTHGNCEIPTGATGIVTNVTIVQPTASSFLTLFPADVAQPLTSNLNWVANQPPTPNQASVGLSGAGAISVFNHAGTVDVIVDIIAYLTPGGSGPAGPPGVQGPPGAKGDQGQQGPPGVAPAALSVDAREYQADTGNVTYTGQLFDACNSVQIDLFGESGEPVATGITPVGGGFTGSFEVPTVPGSYVLIAHGVPNGLSCEAFTVFSVL